MEGAGQFHLRRKNIIRALVFLEDKYLVLLVKKTKLIFHVGPF